MRSFLSEDMPTTETTKTIVIAGDTAVDCFLQPASLAPAGVEPHDARFSLSRIAVLPGGAALLATFIDHAIANDATPARIAGRPRPGELGGGTISRGEVQASAILNLHTVEEHPEEVGRRGPDRRKFYRVVAALGSVCAAERTGSAGTTDPDPPHADIVVLDDFGRGFRDARANWPKALSSSGNPLVVHKLGRPLSASALWSETAPYRASGVVVVTADDLRSVVGVDINRGLSWERSAKDLLYHLQRCEELGGLRRCGNLIVVFGTDGALLYRGDTVPEATMVYDPEHVEGGFAATIRGAMHGLTSAFVAALVARLAREGLTALEDAVKYGLASARSFLDTGFAIGSSGLLEYPLEAIVASADRAGAFTSCIVQPARDLADPDPGFWRILDDRTRNTRVRLARDLVRRGRSDLLRGVPARRFGALQTIDRAEIESYGAIRELIGQFLQNPKPERPLCLAVFGPPGSGKSFGVKQVMKSLRTDVLEARTFNISQFGGYADLVAALHRVRNVALEGHVPFVFLDEFDATSSDGPLGWLKYFLAPMQDGCFKDAGDIHPIGRAIFVFAGGTASTYEEFLSRSSRFENAKVADFCSRLRGFVNVMGPNRQHEGDDAFVIRRAMMLRSMFERLPAANRLLDVRRVLRIDEGVLRALLHVTEYRHGTRSMESILEMSRLAGLDRFDLSALPPRAQLELHVDADEFLFLARQERFQSLALIPRERETGIVEKAAVKIHEDYCRNRVREEMLPGSTATLVKYGLLSDQKRRSNVDAAEHIPVKLARIGHGLRAIEQGETPRTPDITDEEVELLARAEHERWWRDQLLQGVTLGEPHRALTSPHLVPWEEIDETTRRIDVEAVHALPGLLRDLGFELYRMEEAHDFADRSLIELLAREVHEVYLAQAEAKGETPATNSSLVAFDDLGSDLRAANVDQAASISRKLARIGLGVRKVPSGRDPIAVDISDEERLEMAKMEHARWNWQKILQGWRYAPGKKNEVDKTNENIVPWDQLKAEVQQIDIDFVTAIPTLLNKVGYEVYRLGK